MAKKRQGYFNPNQLSIDFDVLDEIEELINQDEDTFVYGDIRNIRKMLPFLREHQQEDLLLAEKRFLEGKGIMFTNGTGTGKTFVGLGISYRWIMRGLNNILVITPTESKCQDWKEEADEKFGIDIHILESIKDGGKSGINTTTYANFYQNDAISLRHWDLIIYDESHYLNQNEKGEPTLSYIKHKDIANVPSSAASKAIDRLGGIPEDNIKEFLEKTKELAKELVEKTKVVFLSATPFAYHKSIKYADGCLFDIEETDYSSGYNEATGFESFMVNNFGYRMRYNKLTIPETGVDQNLMERNFFESLKEKGVISTRILEVDKDYSREFITLQSGIGEKIEKGIDEFTTEYFRENYRYLYKYLNGKYNYNYISQLLEAIKANVIIPRIRQHLRLGRKVIVFHGFNHSLVEHPFHFDAYKMIPSGSENYYYDIQHLRDDIQHLRDDIYKFNDEFTHLLELDISELVNIRTLFKETFGKFMVEFNGTVPKKKRNENKYIFNDDYSGVNIMLAQDKAAREGHSLHDRTGLMQRVSIFLGLPVAPTQAIQLEGRTYRDGVQSNAIYEYCTIQTNYERMAFADKIAKRAKTAENLAMGNLARDLETAFKEGYLNSIDDEPHKNQGWGGKESDREIQTITEFEKAKTFYFSQQKRTSSNKSNLGIDYFATPEPLGYKMVEWMNPSENERWLEPSAGHGAIAKWFKGYTINKFIEPGSKLCSILALNIQGEVINSNFESLAYINKFDKIVMNPPFGDSGKMAAKHIEEAVFHLDLRLGTIMAIVPNGPAMDARLEKLFQTERFEKISFTKELILPSCTFERAGTKVNCKIIVLEKNNYSRWNGNFKRVDLSHCKDINEFFNEIEFLNF